METFSALLAICAGNSLVPGDFPAQRPVTRSFDIFFDLRPNKHMSKQWRGWWFETPSSPLWRQCNEPRLRYSSAIMDTPSTNLRPRENTLWSSQSVAKHQRGWTEWKYARKYKLAAAVWTRDTLIVIWTYLLFMDISWYGELPWKHR